MTVEELVSMAKSAKEAARRLSSLSTMVKNSALLKMADALKSEEGNILEANARDLKMAREEGLSDALLDRMLLTPEQLAAMAHDVRSVAALPDPVGEVFDMRTLPNGLLVGKKRVPIGVLGVIYEARPNVTVDISALSLKSGNAVILRGGKESLRSNAVLVEVISRAYSKAGIPEGAIQFISSAERKLVLEMLRLDRYIDMIIPRGGASLHDLARENSTIPVITGGIGVCHTYVDKKADLEKAARIVYNAKVQRPTVCNALDTLLVHEAVAEGFLPFVADRLLEVGVELRCCRHSFEILEKEGKAAKLAQESDFGQEFLALILSIKVVSSLDEAMDHIYRYGSGHSEAIVTEDYSAAMRFLNEVDAAAVFVNASTRFTDGGQFGLGAEVAISTQKFHARGPMGLKELTSYKWIILGNGQVRE
jgi:glutamate-5-semialdehyde dehydrogenase